MYFVCVCVWVRLNEQLNVFVEILITHGRERKKWNGERQEENLCVHLEPDDENKNALKSSYTHTSFQANKQNRVSSSLHQQQQQQRCKQRPPSLLHFLCVYGWNRSGRVWMHPFSGSTTVCCCACIVLVLYHHHCRRHRHRCLQTLTGKCTYLPTAYTRLIKREKAKKNTQFWLESSSFLWPAGAATCSCCLVCQSIVWSVVARSFCIPSKYTYKKIHNIITILFDAELKQTFEIFKFRIPAVILFLIASAGCFVC